MVGAWCSVFEVFDCFVDVVGGYGDFQAGWEGGCVVVGEFVQPGTAVCTIFSLLRVGFYIRRSSFSKVPDFCHFLCSDMARGGSRKFWRQRASDAGVSLHWW